MPNKPLRKNIQVLEVATGELLVSNDLDLALASLGDDNAVTQVADAALDLDAVVEELFEGRAVKDTVRCRAGVVDDELVLSSSFTSSGLGL